MGGLDGLAGPIMGGRTGLDRLLSPPTRSFLTVLSALNICGIERRMLKTIGVRYEQAVRT